jgi:hypothetical protein
VRTLTAARGQERFIRSGALIAEIDERRNYILFYRGCGCSCHFGCGGGREFVAKLQHHALGGFSADSWNAGEAHEIASTNGGNHFVGGHAAQDLDCQGGADSAYRQQLFEKMFFGEAQESVQAESILANMGVNVKRDFEAGGRHFGKSGNADSDIVTDPVSFDDGLVRMFGEQCSAEMRDHLKLLYGDYCTAGGWLQLSD